MHTSKILIAAFALVACVLCVGARTARADDASAVARRAFDDGTAAFHLGRFDEATLAWERGYRARPDPIFLYNIAQAHRLADRPERAIFFYRSYLTTAPTAPNRDEVERRIAQLERLLAERREVREEPPKEPLPTATVASTAPIAPVTVVRPSRGRVLRGELGLAGGVAVWLTGPGAAPAATVRLRGGAEVWSRGRVAFHAGGAIGYSYVRETAALDSFIDLVAVPRVDVRLWREHLFFAGEAGLGLTVAAGLPTGSAFLSSGITGGPRALFLLRPELALEARPIDRLSLRLACALAYTPTTAGFAARAWLRLEPTLTLAVRL